MSRALAADKQGKSDLRAIPASGAFENTSVWGVPFTPVTYEQTLDLVFDRIVNRTSGYFITANLHYVMLCDQLPELEVVNRDADFIIADGMPIVWRSRWGNKPIPERVAGSDLIYGISDVAAKHGFSIFFLGGAPGVAEEAAQILQRKYPGFEVAGIEVPPFRKQSEDEEAELTAKIQAARPDILFAALGQPKGEQWLHRWRDELGVPVGVQLGGSFNFVTGTIKRSPQWVAAIGMEWFYRFLMEPRRLLTRYLSNAMFLAKALLRDVFNRWPQDKPKSTPAAKTRP